MLVKNPPRTKRKSKLASSPLLNDKLRLPKSVERSSGDTKSAGKSSSEPPTRARHLQLNNKARRTSQEPPPQQALLRLAQGPQPQAVGAEVEEDVAEVLSEITAQFLETSQGVVLNNENFTTLRMCRSRNPHSYSAGKGRMDLQPRAMFLAFLQLSNPSEHREDQMVVAEEALVSLEAPSLDKLNVTL